MITPEKEQFDLSLFRLAQIGTDSYGLLWVLQQMIKDANTNDTHVRTTEAKVLLGDPFGPSIKELSITAVSDKYQKAVTLTVDFFETFKRLAGDELVHQTPTKIAELARGSFFLILKEEPGFTTPCGGFKCKLESLFRKHDPEATRETA